MPKVKRRIYCKFCDYFCYTPEDFVSHIEKHHEELIPEDMTPWQFSYYLRFNKNHGTCVVCKGKTDWNEKSHKYNRFCNNPKCKEKYREVFKNRMIGKYGKTTLLNDPEQQKKMLANRKISGKYVWRDHISESTYTGTYEKSFLEFLDQIMQYDPKDVMTPSPHTYYYEYEGKKHFYIPDLFIPSLNLEIEIKDGGENANQHPKIQAVDKVKEKLKDDVMRNSTFNYIKIVNKENEKFLKYLSTAKEQAFENKEDPIIMIEKVINEYDGTYYAESVMKSTISKDFKKRGHKDLSSFTVKKLTKEDINKNKKYSSLLKHLDETDDICEGFFDNDRLVAYIAINKEKDGKNWITALEVLPEFRGYGLSGQLIKYAINKRNADALSVASDNEVAIDLYKKNGFKVSDESIKNVNDKKNNNLEMFKENFKVF